MNWLKRIISEYRVFFEVPETTSDKIVKARMMIFIILMLLLGISLGNFINLITK